MLSRLKVPVVILIVLAAIGWLVASGVARNDIYVSTLDQWDPARAQRETVRVMGFVQDGSIVTHPERLITEFVIRNESGAKSLPVRFAGVTPDLFREGTSVIAAGRLQPGGTFAAIELMTKCPSKYEGVETPHAGGPPSAGATPAVPETGAGVGT